MPTIPHKPNFQGIPKSHNAFFQEYPARWGETHNPQWLWTCMCMMQNRYVTQMWRQHVRGGNNSEMSSHQPTERCPEKCQHSQAYQIRNREWSGSRPGHTIDTIRLDYPTKFLIGEVPTTVIACKNVTAKLWNVSTPKHTSIPIPMNRPEGHDKPYNITAVSRLIRKGQWLAYLPCCLWCQNQQNTPTQHYSQLVIYFMHGYHVGYLTTHHCM